MPAKLPNIKKVDWVFCDQSTKPHSIHCARCDERVPFQHPVGWWPVDAMNARLTGFTMMHARCLPNAAHVKRFTEEERQRRS